LAGDGRVGDDNSRDREAYEMLAAAAAVVEVVVVVVMVVVVVVVVKFER
jgi:hypothetical protein